ncbi:MAG: class I SAM-dependent methyltransferase [Armatimonadota bacterium]
MSQRDPTQRFSDRAGLYAQHRPGYPPEVVAILCEECGLTAEQTIADLGSGTGLLTEELLKNGNTVFAVEPNEAMRAEAEARLGSNPRFHSVSGRSEATTLPDASVNLITVAQALHWFDPEPTKREFARLLRPGGRLAVVNNKRYDELSPMMAEIDDLLAQHRETPEYGKGWWGWDDAACDFYFGPGGAVERTCPNQQILDEEGFLGRWMSQSTIPHPGEPGHEELAGQLRAIFARDQQAGTVTVPYLTHVHCGRLAL